MAKTVLIVEDGKEYSYTFTIFCGCIWKKRATRS